MKLLTAAAAITPEMSWLKTFRSKWMAKLTPGD